MYVPYPVVLLSHLRHVSLCFLAEAYAFRANAIIRRTTNDFMFILERNYST